MEFELYSAFAPLAGHLLIKTVIQYATVDVKLHGLPCTLIRQLVIMTWKQGRATNVPDKLRQIGIFFSLMTFPLF